MSATVSPSVTDNFWWPSTVTPWVRAMAIASLVANSLLILTGGLVRLTGSGLGCPTWPRCTDESWTNTPEMGFHGVIEFGNRTLTFVLAVVAVLTFIAVLRLRHQYPRMFLFALLLGIGIPVQALIGGITVLVELHPLVVGAHYIVSATMISLATLLVLDTRRAGLATVGYAQRPGQLPGREKPVRLLATAVGILSAIILYVGTLVTGTGPHAGDEDSARLAFEPRMITFTHVVPVYLIVAAVIIAIILGMKQNWPKVLLRAYLLLAGVLVLQALVGYYQYLNNVPIASVAIHMVLSAIMVWASTRVCSISFQVTKDPAEANADRAIARDSDVTEPVL